MDLTNIIRFLAKRELKDSKAKIANYQKLMEQELRDDEEEAEEMCRRLGLIGEGQEAEGS